MGNNDADQASIAGTIAGAKHVHEVAALYGVPVVLHTDHCQKAWLPWIDGLLAASEEHFKKTGQPLFSSHMLIFLRSPSRKTLPFASLTLRNLPRLGSLLSLNWE